MEYKVGEFRKSLKVIMGKADKNEEVIVDCYGRKYSFKLLSSFAPSEVKIVDKDNVEKVINGIKLDKGYVEEKLDLNKFYPCGHQRFPLAQFCRKCV